MSEVTVRYIVNIVLVAVVAASYWYYADPPNPWFLALAGAGLLASIGIIIYKQRAGHFDKGRDSSAE